MPCRDGPAVATAQRLRGTPGRCAHGLDRCEPAFDEQLELTVKTHTGDYPCHAEVGTGQHANTTRLGGADEPAHAGR